MSWSAMLLGEKMSTGYQGHGVERLKDPGNKAGKNGD